MSGVVTIGLDLAKSIFQIHGVDDAGRTAEGAVLDGGDRGRSTITCAVHRSRFHRRRSKDRHFHYITNLHQLDGRDPPADDNGGTALSSPNALIHAVGSIACAIAWRTRISSSGLRVMLRNSAQVPPGRP